MLRGLVLQDFPPQIRKEIHKMLTEEQKRVQMAKGIPEHYALADLPSIAALRATAKQPLKALPENVEKRIGEFLGQMPFEKGSKGQKHHPSRDEIIKTIATLKKQEVAAKKEQERLEKVRIAMEEYEDTQKLKDTVEMLERKKQKEKSRTRRGKNYNWRNKKMQNTYVVRGSTRKA